MTKDEIIEMAKQVGMKWSTDVFRSEFCDGIYDDDLLSFAKLVQDKTIERLANIADGYRNHDVAFIIKTWGNAL